MVEVIEVSHQKSQSYTVTYNHLNDSYATKNAGRLSNFLSTTVAADIFRWKQHENDFNALLGMTHTHTHTNVYCDTSACVWVALFTFVCKCCYVGLCVCVLLMFLLRRVYSLTISAVIQTFSLYIRGGQRKRLRLLLLLLRMTRMAAGERENYACTL